MPHSISTQDLQRACFELEVFVQGKSIGVLEMTTNGYITFQYYPRAGNEDFVSLLMPVRSQPYRGARPGMLPPVFDMNLPEGGLRHALISRYGKVVSHFNDLALLALVGRTTIGRVTLGGPQAESSNPLDIKTLAETRDADSLLSKLYQSDSILSGIAGAQPKVIASLDPDNLDKLSDSQLIGSARRATIRSEDAIVKTSDANYPWLAANEFHCLRAAQLSGLDVPDASLLRNGQILVLARFDRDDSEPLGAEDFCALNALPTSSKYTLSYERVTKTLALFDSPGQLAHDNHRLFHSIALSCVLRNGDAHLKNFMLLYRTASTNASPQVWLSPSYDLCTTNAYLPEDRLALTLAGSKRYPTHQKLHTFARQHSHLLDAAITDIYQSIATGVNAAAKELLEYGERYPEFHAGVGCAMLRCWQAGLHGIGHHLDIDPARITSRR